MKKSQKRIGTVMALGLLGCVGLGFQNCGDVHILGRMDSHVVESTSAPGNIEEPVYSQASKTLSNIRVKSILVSESAPQSASSVEFTNADVGEEIFFFSDALCSQKIGQKKIASGENLQSINSVLQYDFSSFTEAERGRFQQNRGSPTDAELLDPTLLSMGQRFSLFTHKIGVEGKKTNCENVFSLVQASNQGTSCAKYADQSELDQQMITRNCVQGARINGIKDIVNPAFSFQPNPYLCGMEGEHQSYRAHSLRVQKTIPRIIKIRFKRDDTVRVSTDNMWANSLINIHHPIPPSMSTASLRVRAKFSLEPCDPKAEPMIFSTTTMQIDHRTLERSFPGDARLQGEEITVYVTLNAAYEMRSGETLPDNYNCDKLFCATDIQIY